MFTTYIVLSLCLTFWLRVSFELTLFLNFAPNFSRTKDVKHRSHSSLFIVLVDPIPVIHLFRVPCFILPQRVVRDKTNSSFSSVHSFIGYNTQQHFLVRGEPKTKIIFEFCVKFRMENF